MKVVHLCLGAFFPDNYAYQENMLPKFHKQLGLDVEVIASQETFDENGKITYMDFSGMYQNEYNIKVTRLEYSFPAKYNHRLKHYKGVDMALEKANPEILFVHNCQFTSIFSVINYLKKHSKVIVYVDNHVDFSNSAKNWVSKNILHKGLWKICAQAINPYVSKFYGVLPARVDFLKKVYNLPTDKVELLVMGADDDTLKAAKDDKCRQKIRNKYKLNNDDILLLTGGKIDDNKLETLMLMKAIASMEKTNIKLMIFGSVIDSLKKEFNSLLEYKNIIYIGWVKSDLIYRYFEAADIVLFPGLHSVLWEQAAGSGKPCVYRKIEGFTHIDLGGNCDYFEDLSVNGIKQTLLKIIKTNTWQNMQKIAEEKCVPYFSYREIAMRSINYLYGGK